MSGGPSRADSLRLLEQEVGTVVRRVKRVIGERASMVHECLQPAAYVILNHVEAHGPLRAAELVEAFDIDKGAISRQVQHLLDLGLLTRAPDPDDGRAHLLSITPETVARLAEVSAQRRVWLDDQLGDWSTEELATFAANLARYNRALATDSDA